VKAERLSVELTRAEAQAIVDSIEHGDVAYGQSWSCDLAGRAEVEARKRAVAKLLEALEGS
jgi:hypothetical protein